MNAQLLKTRRRIIVGALAGIMAGALGVLHAQPSTMPARVADTITHFHRVFPTDSLRAAIRYLAGEELAGRRTGTPENLAAAEYIAGKFRESGLRPLPGGDGYFHRFEYLAGAENGKSNALAIIGPGGETAARMGSDFLPMTFSGVADVSGELVFAGYGITAPDDRYDDYAGIDARGKIVLVMRYSPEGINPHGGLARHTPIAVKVANARDHGAAGIIFINPPADSPSAPSVRFDRNFTNAGLPAAMARAELFNALRDPAGRTLAGLQQRIDSSRVPASFLVSGYRVRLATDVRLRRELVPNVVGVLPGSDPKLRDEFIVIGGHFDHLGWGGEGSLHGHPDSAIHHGADDNASGTAGVIALARLFASQEHRRSLIFIAFNGEEEGLLGSAALVEKPPFPLERVAAMINMDMIGRLDSANLIVQGTGTSPSWSGLLTAANREWSIIVGADSSPRKKVIYKPLTLKMVADGFGPSDHASFYGKGVPVLFFFTGLHADYHRPSDVWEKINYDGEMRVLDYVSSVVQAIDANTDRPAFTKTQRSAEGSATGFKVYVGTIPDYAYDGKGLRLSGVAEGGPAQRAGLKEGDVIMRMGSKGINNIYDYTHALGEFKPKQVVEVEYLRDGTTRTAKVELGSR